jgi:hydroxyacylglutathione hydrolase
MKIFTYYSVTDFSNTYLLGPSGHGDAVLIDPGEFDLGLLKLIEKNGYHIRHILISHAHNAHINGIRTLMKIYQSRIYSFNATVLDYPAQPVRDGDCLLLGEFSIEVIETPGHSDEALCFRLGRLLFTGDTLTAGQIAETDNPAQRDLLIDSIRRKLFTLEDCTFIFPGHGPPSRLEIEKKLNPFLRPDPEPA